jgi:hypothetical protein
VHWIAELPAAGQVVLKERINAIALPSADDIRRDSDLFVEGLGSPESQRRIQTAMEHGFQTRDADLDLAGMQGDLSAE